MTNPPDTINLPPQGVFFLFTGIAQYILYDQTAMQSSQLQSFSFHYYNYSSNSYAHSLLCSMQGSAFREQILTAMQNNSFFNNKMLSYNATAEGRALYSSYYHTVLHTFPLFLDEVRGMADGAKILFSKVSQSVSQSICQLYHEV